MVEPTNYNLIRRWWKIVDQQTIIGMMVLFLFSLMLVTTSSPAVANRIGLVDNYFSSRQIIFLFAAAIIILVFSFLDKLWIKRIAILGYGLTVVALILVKFYGYEVKGATRWINIAGFSYQPSEFMKPFFAVVTGWVLSLKYRNNNQDFPSFHVVIILYLLVALLIVIQPDFGMLVMITTVFGIQLFVAGLPIILILFTLVGGVVGFIGAYFALPHVAARINNFLDPANNENFQVSRSIMAFEHGGMYGTGPGEGTVKQTLPDCHTDFIFAVAGEEFGAIICLVIIGVFAYIVLRNLIRILSETDKFVQLATLGIIAQFGIQSAINIGVTLNLLPTKGMTLPFISYGGSSTLAVSIGMGMLIGLTKRKTSLIRYRNVSADLG